ncbi:MAG TPA: class I SAM-dependent methyltransferase [Bacillota bacterium]|nr:class I SAM-dependent methyltransferase [Bacillota bacterium]
MGWQTNFYRKQFLWSKKHMDYDMETLVEHSIDKLRRLCDSNAHKILELGGGNGQFAVTAAQHGYDITVIEIIPECVEHIYHLKEKYHIGENLRIIEGDFYEVSLMDSFDVVCYWDGFGIESDAEQQLLLRNISNWLKPGGTALIDIYTPWYWAAHAGQEVQFGKIHREYGFDAEECRMLDNWWLADDKENVITQSLRCYSPVDLKLLLNDTELQFIHYESGGAMDYENWTYHESVSLEKAMMYTAKLQKE